MPPFLGNWGTARQTFCQHCWPAAESGHRIIMRWTTSNEFSEEFCQFVAPSNNYKSKLLTSTPAMFITNYSFHKLVFVICLNLTHWTRCHASGNPAGPHGPLKTITIVDSVALRTFGDPRAVCWPRQAETKLIGQSRRDEICKHSSRRFCPINFVSPD